MHWPASNIHPSHEIYPEFDPKKPIEPGKSWVMVFSNSGSWRYHDHLHPSVGGTIVVNNQKKTTNFFTAHVEKWFEKTKLAFGNVWAISLQIYFEVFPAKKQEFLNHQQIKEIADKNELVKLAMLLDLFGDKKIMELLQTQSNNGSKYNCHQPAHQVGRIAYKNEGDKALLNNITICNSGYHHGVMAGFVYGLSTNEIINKINETCDLGESNFAKLTCFHGAGHGLLAFFDYDVPEAIKNCRSLQTQFAQENCLVGVFMENIATQFGDSLNPHGTKWLNNDMHYPCNRIDQSGIVQRACYAMQPLWISAKLNNNFTKVIDVCLQALPENIPDCLFGTGEVIGLRANFNPQYTQKICSQIPEEPVIYQEACFRGATTILMDFWGPDIENKGTDFCSGLSLQNIGKCNNYLNKQGKNYIKS